MIDWLLTHHRDIVRFSRWIIAGCALAVLGIASLPRNPVDRVVAIVALAAVAVVVGAWLIIVSITVIRPRLLDDWRRRRP